jgi:hypothetical protein
MDRDGVYYKNKPEKEEKMMSPGMRHDLVLLLTDSYPETGRIAYVENT